MTHNGPEALPQAFFLPARLGQRYCLFHSQRGTTLKSRVLYLHPFAEEMHAARRVVAQQCRSLAADGHAVLQIDLLGCGDSNGDFGDATWLAWVEDALLGLRWLHEHTFEAPTWIWGLRAGALLACNTAQAWLAEHPAKPLNLLLWQPVASGQQQLQQFLRLHAAAQWLGRVAIGEPPAEALNAGRDAYVAGYRLSHVLAAELRNATLDLYPGQGRIELIEMTNAQPPMASPWIVHQAAQWKTAGWQVRTVAINATSFWQHVVESDLSDELDVASKLALA